MKKGIAGNHENCLSYAVKDIAGKPSKDTIGLKSNYAKHSYLSIASAGMKNILITLKYLLVIVLVLLSIGNSIAEADCGLLSDDIIPLCEFVDEYGTNEAISCGIDFDEIMTMCNRHPCEYYSEGIDLNTLIDAGAQTGELLECAYGCELVDAGVDPGEIIDEGYLYELTDCMDLCEIYGYGAELTDIVEVSWDIDELLQCVGACELVENGVDLNEVMNASGDIDELLQCAGACELVDEGGDLNEIINVSGDINELLQCVGACELLENGGDLNEIINVSGDINELLQCVGACELVENGVDLNEVMNASGDIDELLQCAGACELVDAGGDLNEIINASGDIDELLQCVGACEIVENGGELSNVISSGVDVNELLQCASPCDIINDGGELNAVIDAGADVAEVFECSSPCEIVDSGSSADISELLNSGASVDEIIGCVSECDIYAGGGELYNIINAGGGAGELLGCAGSCQIFNSGGDLNELVSSGGDIGELLGCTGSCDIVNAGAGLNDVIGAGGDAGELLGCANPCEIINNGGDLNEVIDAGAAVDEMLECTGPCEIINSGSGADISEFINAGASVDEMIACVGECEIYGGGGAIDNILNAGGEIGQLLGCAGPCEILAGGGELNLIISAGGNSSELMSCTASCDIVDAGGSLSEIINTGGSISELSSCADGCELFAAGGNLNEILNYATAAELLACGAGECSLISAGSDIHQLLSAGISVAELLICGVTADELLAAGVDCFELRFAGVDEECGLGDPEEGGDKPCGAPIWKVNRVNMNLFVSDIPLWYNPAIGPPVEIQLSYNSHAAVTGNTSFGRKWTFNYGSYIDVGIDGMITIYMPDGGRKLFIPDEFGGYNNPYGVFDTLNEIAQDHYELKQVNGTVYVFNVPSSLNSSVVFLGEIRDAYNQKLTIAYNSNDQLQTITDALGKVTTLLDNNSDGLIDQVNGPFGRSAYFTYNLNGDLAKITDMGGYWTEFNYDGDVYITAIKNERGQWRIDTEPDDVIDNGSTPYPAPGEAMWKNYRITITDPVQNREEYYYYHNGRYSWYISPRDYVSYTSPNDNNYTNAVKTYYYLNEDNSNGKIEKIEFPGGGHIEYQYDSLTGKSSLIMDYHKHGRSYTYNDIGLVSTMTDAYGNITAFEYYPNNIDVERISLDLISTPENDNITIGVFTYNGAAHAPATYIDRLGTITEFAYNAYGQMQSVTLAKGTTVEMTTDNIYDPVTHELLEIKRSGYTIASYTHDENGRVRTYTDAKGFTVTYWEYDNLDRPEIITYPDTVFNAGVPELKYLDINYSSCCPRMIDSVTDRTGLTTNYSYDDLKRLVEIQKPGETIKYKYDMNGNMIRLIDAGEISTYFKYNLDNRMITKIYTDGGSIDYNYDPAGVLTGITNSRNIEKHYSYDERHNILAVEYSDDTPDLVFTYDDYGRQETMSDGLGIHRYGYDEIDRLISLDGPWPDDTIIFQYNQLNHLKKLIPQIGRTISYYHDYDPANPGDIGIGRLKQIQSGADTYAYGYTGVNPLIQDLTRPNGSLTEYTYNDPLLRLTEISNNNNAGEIINKRIFTYNDHDLIGSEQTVNEGPIPSFQIEDTVYNSNILNQLDSLTDQKNSTNYPFAYDDDGNMTQGYTPGGYMFIASYDAENRLISIEYTDAGSVDHKTEYIYAGNGFLAEIKKYENAELVDDVRIVSAGQLPLQERDGYNNIIREYTWGLNAGGGIGGLLGLRQAGNNYSYLYDGRGNVTTVLDEADNIASSYQYSPFGMLISKAGPLDQPFMFSTKRYDDSTGLNYYGYRFYNPSLGKWMTRDPIGETGGINLYGFVGNNPVNYYDPWGLWSVTGSLYYGYGGSVSFGKSKGQWFALFGGGVGFGGGLTFNPNGSLPGTPSNSTRAFMGSSAWIGCTLGPLSGGWAGAMGLDIQKDANGIPYLDYVQKGAPYGSLKGNADWGVKLGGGINVVDVGIAW